jgi:hypothetical protein
MKRFFQFITPPFGLSDDFKQFLLFENITEACKDANSSEKEMPRLHEADGAIY